MGQYPCLALSDSTHKERVEALSWAERQLGKAFPRERSRFRRAFLDLVVISAAHEAA